MENEEILLEVKGISKEFSGKRVVDRVNFTVAAGEIVALIGENGAGKSTIKNMLCGLLTPTDGEIYFQGNPLSKMNRKDYSVAAVHQELSLFPTLSVAENITITGLPGKQFCIDYTEMRKIAQEYLDLLKADFSPDDLLETLGPGEAQQVEIAKALYQNPKLLILDEPTASLTAPERNKLFEIMRTLKHRNVGMIFITHFIDEIYAISDKIVVLRNGMHVGGGQTSDLPRQTVEELLVGHEMKAQKYELPPVQKDIALKVEGFCSDRFHDLSFEVHRGEILGIAGLMGAGRTEIIETIYGLRPLDQGKLSLYGKTLHKWTPGSMKRAGVAFVSEERKKTGIFPYRSIKENLTCADPGHACKRRIKHFGWRQEKESAIQMAKSISLSYGSIDFNEVSLSGGNQQKSIMARWLSLDPQICIFDDPTRGVDIGAKAQISQLIIEQAKKGCAMIIVSSDINELLQLSHRILVMQKGRITAEVERGSEAFNARRIITIAAASEN